MLLDQILTSKTRSSVTEAELESKMIQYLKRWFNVSSQIWSTDHKRRIDLIITHLTDFNQEFPIGVEIKLAEKKTGKSLASWLKQASEYSELEFTGFGKCLIITCPQVSELYMKEGDLISKHPMNGSELSQHNNITTFIGQFNVGEIQKCYWNNKQYSKIVFKGWVIWDSRYNQFDYEKYKMVCPR